MSWSIITLMQILSNFSHNSPWEVLICLLLPSIEITMIVILVILVGLKTRWQMNMRKIHKSLNETLLWPPKTCIFLIFFSRLFIFLSISSCSTFLMGFLTSTENMFWGVCLYDLGPWRSGRVILGMFGGEWWFIIWFLYQGWMWDGESRYNRCNSCDKWLALIGEFWECIVDIPGMVGKLMFEQNSSGYDKLLASEIGSWAVVGMVRLMFEKPGGIGWCWSSDPGLIHVYQVLF